MTYRSAEPADQVAIIDLLRLSLGEGSTEKTAEFWEWKHVDNPFGPSPVLVAEDAGKIVGVRAFMRWAWQSRERSYRALRAVDTATHPDYRGKGIFKKLTLQLLAERKAAGDDFIFNTPNDQSRPGYLKMGWTQLGKLPVRMAPLRPLRIARQLAFGGEVRPLQLAATSFAALDETKKLGWLTDGSLLPAAGWHTPPTPEFLRWRYAACPARTYYLSADPANYLIVYYGREQAVGSELRIVHYLVRPGAEALAKRALAELRRAVRPNVMTVAPTAGLPMYFLPALPLGLILTFAGLNLTQHPPLPRWQYAMGDLELF